MSLLEQRKARILSLYGNNGGDIQKSNINHQHISHKPHKYLRKEGDRYIYEEPKGHEPSFHHLYEFGEDSKNNLDDIKNDISLPNKQTEMIDQLKAIQEEKKLPKKTKETLQNMINYLGAEEIPEREFSNLFKGIDILSPIATPLKSSYVSRNSGNTVDNSDYGATIVVPSYEIHREYKDAFGLHNRFHTGTATVVKDFNAMIERLEGFKAKYKGKFDTSFVDKNIADVKRALPVAEAMNELRGKIVTTKELNRREKKANMPYNYRVISDAVKANPIIAEKLDQVEASYIDRASRNPQGRNQQEIKRDAEDYRDLVIGNLVNAVGKITNGQDLKSFEVHNVRNGKGGFEGSISVNGVYHRLEAIYASGPIQQLHIRFLIK